MDSYEEYFPSYPPMTTLINTQGEQNVRYQCPSDLAAFDMSYTIGLRFSYGQNLSITSPASAGITGITAVKCPMIKRPSETPFWAEAKPFTGTPYYDSNGTQANSRNYVYGPGGMTMNCATRHTNGSNYVSVAGAASWAKTAVLNSWEMPYWKFKR